MEVKSRLKVGRKKNFFLPKVKKRVEWQKFYEAVCGRSMQTTCRFEPNCFFPLASSKKVAWGLIFHIEMRVVSRIFESYTSIESRVTRPAKFLFKYLSIGEFHWPVMLGQSFRDRLRPDHLQYCYGKGWLCCVRNRYTLYNEHYWYN